jgi:hypothetical protein
MFSLYISKGKIGMLRLKIYESQLDETPAIDYSIGMMAGNCISQEVEIIRIRSAPSEVERSD